MPSWCSSRNGRLRSLVGFGWVKEGERDKVSFEQKKWEIPK